MPVSRKRNRPSSRRRANGDPTTRRSVPAGHERQRDHTVAVSLRDLTLRKPDPEDVACMARALEAGAGGDASACLAHELSGSVIVESPHRFILKDLVDQGDLAPSWAYSRWCLDLAYRSMLLCCDPRTDEAVHLVMGALCPNSVRACSSEADWRFLATMLAARDHAVQDLAVFELGGLRDYLAQVAQPGLLSRTDRIGEWVDASVGVYLQEGFQGCRSILRDLVTDERVEVLNLGSGLGVLEGSLIGRLVPISAEPGLMFAQHPMTVEAETGHIVADAVRSGVPLGWLVGLSEAMSQQGLPEGFHDTPTTAFTSELPIANIDCLGDPPSEAGRIVELRAKGHSAEVANALGVLEVGLIAAGVSDQAAAVVGPHVAAVLATPAVFAAAQRECTGAGTADAWRVLAGVVPDHLTERCLLLAAQDGPVAGP